MLLLTMTIHGRLLAQWQDYEEPDVSMYHASSVYYFRLFVDGQDASGLAQQHPHLVTAYIGEEQRGVSEPMEVNGKSIFMLRVWGSENDPSTATFCIKNGNNEYIVGSHDFAPGEDTTFSSPLLPLSLRLVLPTGIEAVPGELRMRPGDAQQLDYKLLPEDISDVRGKRQVQVRYRVANSQVASCSNTGLVQALSLGHTMIDMIVYIDDVTYRASVPVTVHNESVHVTDIRNDEKDGNGKETFSLTKYVGEEFTPRYTVLPEDADDKRVNVTIGDYNLLGVKTDGDVPVFVPRREGQTTITLETRDGGFTLNYEVTIERERTDPVTLTMPAEVTLSKLTHTTIQLAKSPKEAVVKTALLYFDIDAPAHGGSGWGPAAEGAADSGPVAGSSVTVTMKGRYAGVFHARIYYNGEQLKNDKGGNEMTLLIPAETALDAGWNWVSPYAVGADGSFYPEGNPQWMNDSEGGIEEIRSQTGWLIRDGSQGYEGGIARLTPQDGMYKMRVKAKAGKGPVLSAAPQGMVYGPDMARPRLHHGYTWVGYPHELNHSVAMLAPYLAATAQEGDQLIGQNGFVEFDGENWEGTGGFILESGHGYIYYTEGPGGYALNWGPYELDPETLETDEEAVAEASAYADRMNVVLQTDGQAVEAFVSGELRSQATSAESGLTYISVPGQVGEEVVLRIGGAQLSLPFVQRAGSRRVPLSIGSWPSTPYRAQEATFDLQGRRMKDADSLRPGVYISNGRKLIVNNKK